MRRYATLVDLRPRRAGAEAASPLCGAPPRPGPRGRAPAPPAARLPLPAAARVGLRADLLDAPLAAGAPRATPRRACGGLLLPGPADRGPAARPGPGPGGDA